FHMSLQGAQTIQNLRYLRDRIADMTRMTDELQHMIDITQRMEDLTRQLTAVTHDMDVRSKQMQANTNELRDRIADFDDFWRPIRSYFHWERHCVDIPICWSTRSLFDAMDGVDKLSEDVGSLVDNLGRLDTLTPQMLAQFAPLIATMKTVK